MNLILNPTTKVVQVVDPESERSIPARVWEGTTESGIPVTVLVTRIAVNNVDDTAEFEAELEACRPPSTYVDAWPNRLVL